MEEGGNKWAVSTPANILHIEVLLWVSVVYQREQEGKEEKSFSDDTLLN